MTSKNARCTCLVVAILTLTLVWAESEENVLKELYNIESEVQGLKTKIQQLEVENLELKNEVAGFRATGPFTIAPENTYGIVGENITLDCEGGPDLPGLTWYRPGGQSVASSVEGVFPEFADEYAAVIDGNSISLIVLDADLDDAGQYDCYMPFHNSQAYAEIIMLASSVPTCTETPVDWSDLIEGGVISLECEVGYQGLWAPIQDWTDSDGNILLPSNLTTDSVVLYENAHTVTSDDNGDRWIVETRFPPPPEGAIPDDVTAPPSRYYSRVVPTYTALHESSTITVLSPVSDVVIDPVQSEYHPGDTITCSAQGNPYPDIRWLDIFNNTVIDGPTLLITPAMEGAQTFMCLATNVIDDETYIASISILFNVTIPPVTDVSFYVFLNETTTITPGSILIYDVVVTNVGGGYNVNSGTFTAPLHGLYYFDLYMQTYQDVNSPLALYLNNQMQCGAQAVGDYDQGTCSALIELQVGDVVNVKAVAFDVTVYGEYPSNGLVGYLYQAL